MIDFPSGFRIAGPSPIDDRLVVPNTGVRDQLIIDGRAFEGMLVYVVGAPGIMYRLEVLGGTPGTSIWADTTNIDGDTIIDGTVSNSVLEDMAPETIKARSNSGSGAPEDLGRVAISQILINDVGSDDESILSAEQVDSRIAAAVASNVKLIGGYNANTNTPDLDSGTPIAGIKSGNQ